MYRNFDRLADAFYWPLLDLLLWGLTALYVEQLFSNFLFIKLILSGLIFWYIIYRVQGDITVNLLEEYWSHNFVNIFVSPLTFNEWLVSLLVNGVVKGAVSFSFAALIALILYHVKIFALGFYILPFALLLMLSGWAIGFAIAGLFFRYGQKIQFLAWTLVYVISPFSAIYYPVSILPFWAQKISAIIPTSYVFEGIRQVLNTGSFNSAGFYISLVLNLFYLALALLYMRASFRKALERGLINIR
jgi:ABC-2 type transport system permease protein